MINTEYGLLPTLIGSTATVRNQVAQLQEQVATGQVSQTYSGLGTGALTSLNLQPQIAHQTVWQSNIDAAQGRLNVTQTAMTSISSIASQFYASANSLNTSDPATVAGIAQEAKAALQQIGQLLNSKSGDVYVFAGQDTGNPPMPNTDPTVMATDLLASSTATPPFSTTLGTAVAEAEVGQGQRVQVGLLANQNTLAVSSPPTTGSYMRDTMTALAALSQMTPANAASTAATAATQLSGAVSAMSTEAGALGNIQSTLASQKTELSDTSTALTTQLSSIENVDMATAITQLQTLQTQLQASYQIIAQAQTMTLANYIQP